MKEDIKREKLKRVITVHSVLLDVINNTLKESESDNNE